MRITFVRVDTSNRLNTVCDAQLKVRALLINLRIEEQEVDQGDCVCNGNDTTVVTSNDLKS